MFRRYIPREKEPRSLIPPFDHDPHIIRFRSWTALLSLAGEIPDGPLKDQASLFLDEEAESCGVETMAARRPVSLRNPTRCPHLNVGIVCGRTGGTVFHAQELPAGRYLKLEFLKEGTYTVHYSPAFSGVTLRRSLRIVVPANPEPGKPSDFRPSLKPKRWD